MSKDKGHKPLSTTEQMRRQAEAQVRAKTKGQPPPGLAKAQRLLHELEVHQIELEMQNAELHSARHELELAHTKYAEIFEFAPIGYFILDQRGRIQEANLAMAQLLGIERGLLVDKAFDRFIEEAEDRSFFKGHLEQLLQSQAIQCCELNLKRSDGSLFHGLLQSAMINASESLDGRILTSILDDTENHNLRLKLQKAQTILEDKVSERTTELSRANAQLMEEIEEHKQAKASLKGAFSQIQQLSERLQAENLHLQQEISRDCHFGEIIGHSDAMAYVFFRVEQVAPQDATVLLLGETGSGKGLVARAIHNRSARKARPMITVNCTALPANLIESELFGREKGAFTGASARQMGRFELADGGTIFLDEIGEMPMELQVKLLRVIQDGEFERLGSPRTLKVNVRIIAASNRNLEEEIRAGRFREDLFYRLSVFPITIPPLRQRSDDIELLMRHFVAKYSKKIGKQIDTVPKETLELFQDYHWPGNVRELENVIERAVITSQGPVLRVLDQFDNLRKPQPEQDVKALADLERDHIVQVLQKTAWRIEGEKGAALILGLNPSTLRARMRKYGIRRQ